MVAWTSQIADILCEVLTGLKPMPEEKGKKAQDTDKGVKHQKEARIAEH